MEVIYEDNHILIAHKPEGIPTQEGGLEEQAKAWIKDKYKKPGAVFLHPVHRLDKVASGLVLFARTSKALSRLQAQMREQKIKKTYIAYVEGTPTPAEATLEHFLEHGNHKAIVSPGGKRSLLYYRILETVKGISKLEINLITGRYHQIRAQLAAIGHPIVGDIKYGSRLAHTGPGIALQHVTLEFSHPVTARQDRYHRLH